MVFPDEYDAAIKRAEAELARQNYAVKAKYNATKNKIEVELMNGLELSIPPSILQALSEANNKQLSKIELTPLGNLYFPLIEEDISIPSLVLGVFGNKPWMEKLKKQREMTNTYLAPHSHENLHVTI